MKQGTMVPPECCVIMEMEQGVRLGYRKAVLLNEIEVLGSLEKAAKMSKIDLKHAWDLVMTMNREFSEPLVLFQGGQVYSDTVKLSSKGAITMRTYWRKFEPVWNEIVEERSRYY